MTSNPLVNTEQTVASTEKKEFAIGSVKYTLSELVTHLGLDAKTSEEKYEEIAMHLRKGSVQALNKQTKQEKILASVQKGLAGLAHVRQLAAEKQQEVLANRKAKNEDRLTYDDIKFSVANRVIAEDVKTYLEKKGLPIIGLTQDMLTYEFVFELGEVTDTELNALDRYLKVKEFTVKSKSAGTTALTVTSVVAKGALDVTGGIIGGTTKLAVDITGKTVEAVTEIGANAVVRTRDIYQASARNLSNSQDAVEAKELIASGWDAMKRKMGGNKKSRFFS